MYPIAQALSEPNPAAHAIWWIAVAIAVVLVFYVVLELLDGLRARVRSWRERATPAQIEAEPGDFRLEAPDSEVRRRHLEQVVANAKGWTEGLIEHDKPKS